MIYFYTLLIGFILIFAVFMNIKKRRRLKAVQAMFREYNEVNDTKVIHTWIQERDTQGRLADALEYLVKIEDDELALKVAAGLRPDDFTTRQTRVLGCKAFMAGGKEEEALALAFALVRDTPDDSTLDIYLDVCLTFNKLEDVRRILMPRLEQKMEGTIFRRHHARLLFAEGDKTKAIEIMADIVNKDFVLYKNTFAPAQKRLIYEQYVESQKLLDHMEGKPSEVE